ncbi:unnamed protein product [Wuchereria bancrofti]|uniref:REM-1 domain-containing protein n=1 Tax=Wuchereria bancrofti TaxID=6293 RepID=A0A3P7FTN2_WUCBA|nr:unnamed protein product [Wuchereria bancrofti]
MKVKDGLERFLAIGQTSRKLQEESKSMLFDSKAKIALLRMQIEKMQRQEQVGAGLSGKTIPTKAEMIVDDLLFRLRKEAAIAEGARNMIRILSSQRKSDGKSLSQAFDNQMQSEEKLDLIRLALAKYSARLPNDSPKKNEIRDAILESERLPLTGHHDRRDGTFSPPSSAPGSPSQDDSKSASLPRLTLSLKRLCTLPSLAVSGRLEVRLIGCQNLMADIPRRLPRTEVSSMIAVGGDGLSSFTQKARSTRGSGQRTSSSPGNYGRKQKKKKIDIVSYMAILPIKSAEVSSSMRQDLHQFGVLRTPQPPMQCTATTKLSPNDEVTATLLLDSREVACTDSRPVSQQAWDQHFSIDLDRSKELEIEIRYRDWRSICAFTIVKLGDIVEPSERAGMVLNLEPQGDLFAEFKYLNPVVSRKPKLERQKRLFRVKGILKALKFLLKMFLFS